MHKVILRKNKVNKNPLINFDEWVFANKMLLLNRSVQGIESPIRLN